MGNTLSLIQAVLELGWTLVVTAAAYAVMWGVFRKAGKPGWACLVPFYNMILLCRICALPGWLGVPASIPGLSLLVWPGISLNLAKAFGKSSGFALGTFFLAPVFFLILASDGSVYRDIRAAQEPPSSLPSEEEHSDDAR